MGYLIFPWINRFFYWAHPFIFLDGDKPAAAVPAGPQIPFFLLVTDPAEDIEVYLKAVSFTTVRAEFCWHA
jgi:hypothetical protein